MRLPEIARQRAREEYLRRRTDHHSRVQGTDDAESSLSQFTREAFHVIDPSSYVHGWHVDAMAEHLEAVSRQEIQRLIINIPPRRMKSLMVSVCWPAWVWAQQILRTVSGPQTRFLSLAYGEKLSTRDSVKTRNLILSPWYQAQWGDRFHILADQNTKTHWVNDKGGQRFASSFGGGVLGEGGDAIIVDDPHKPDEVKSDDVRTLDLEWYDETIPNRLNDKKRSAIVLIMQRLHEKDLTGHLLAKELGITHLCLPEQYEEDHPCRWVMDPRKVDGEPLWPEREDLETIEAAKAEIGSYAVAGQYQQRPAPRKGGMFNKASWNYIEKSTEAGRRVRGWDLASSTKKKSPYTVGVKMLKRNDGHIVIEDVERIRGTPGEVEKAILACAEQDGPQVEIDIPQDPGQAGVAQKVSLAKLLHGYDVHFGPETGSKEVRATPLSAQQEAGNVSLVRAPWNDAFIEEGGLFPNSEYKDQIDAASRGYARLISRKQRTAGVAPRVVEVG